MEGAWATGRPRHPASDGSVRCKQSSDLSPGDFGDFKKQSRNINLINAEPEAGIQPTFQKVDDERIGPPPTSAHPGSFYPCSQGERR